MKNSKQKLVAQYKESRCAKFNEFINLNDYCVVEDITRWKKTQLQAQKNVKNIRINGPKISAKRN